MAFPLNDPAELRAVVRLEATLVGSPPTLARLRKRVRLEDGLKLNLNQPIIPVEAIDALLNGGAK
jgi:hypothetical protein